MSPFTLCKHLLCTGACASLSPLALLSCSDCDFERKRVESFLAKPENLSCHTDADCTVTGVDCLEVKGAFCGQVVLNKRANDSATWRDSRNALKDCVGVDPCTTCDALRVAMCQEGSCR